VSAKVNVRAAGRQKKDKSHLKSLSVEYIQSVKEFKHRGFIYLSFWGDAGNLRYKFSLTGVKIWDLKRNKCPEK